MNEQSGLLYPLVMYVPNNLASVSMYYNISLEHEEHKA